ncbi:hypothetical protein GRI62_08065 [Erythrobacter arachoides]|uniref:Uncharacterized protein n=1 Tax=Aurantiacibacter arachoides TaxID=1850444 RepID=A0A845A1V9_9SPHN|nr:hypothetical protein [Aurantiacibacter arachoides]MXO93560.1 hypothetical protein [Aurantiacibacter arachoides]GGD48436.1 hypothetical protein GCM10011411_05210 [Aurantiacibacter arachoides]
MSRMTVSYESAAPVGIEFLSPARGAFGAVGGILGSLAAIAILLATVGIPVLGGLLGLRWLRQRLAVGPAAVG